MNCELWAPGKPSFTKPYCGKQGSVAMDPIISSYLWDSNEETEHSTETKKHKRTAAILEDQEWKQITPRAEEGYCNEATQSGPLTHSQSHQAQNAAEHTEVKQRGLGQERK